jgi:hypothetical protein
MVSMLETPVKVLQQENRGVYEFVEPKIENDEDEYKDMAKAIANTLNHHEANEEYNTPHKSDCSPKD